MVYIIYPANENLLERKIQTKKEKCASKGERDLRNRWEYILLKVRQYVRMEEVHMMLDINRLTKIV